MTSSGAELKFGLRTFEGRDSLQMMAWCLSSTGISSLHTRDKNPALRADTKGQSCLQPCRECLSPLLMAREVASPFFPHPHILCLHRTQQATATHFSWQLTLLFIKVQKFGGFFRGKSEVSPYDQAATSLPLDPLLSRGLCFTKPHLTPQAISSPRSQPSPSPLALPSCKRTEQT